MDQGRKTRRAFCERYADRPVLVLGMRASTIRMDGHVVRHGETWRFRVTASA